MRERLNGGGRRASCPAFSRTLLLVANRVDGGDIGTGQGPPQFNESPILPGSTMIEATRIEELRAAMRCPRIAAERAPAVAYGRQPEMYAISTQTALASRILPELGEPRWPPSFSLV